MRNILKPFLAHAFYLSLILLSLNNAFHSIFLEEEGIENFMERTTECLKVLLLVILYANYILEQKLNKIKKQND